MSTDHFYTAQNPELAIPTGSPSLDLALGTDGWPRGRIVEIFGPESGGKTTLLLEAIRQAQRLGGKSVFIDADFGAPMEMAKRYGTPSEAIAFHRVNHLEGVFDILERSIRQKVDVIALDSIASVMLHENTKFSHLDAEQHKDEKLQYAIEYCLKALLPKLAESRAVLLISNQLREKVGVMFGSPETTPWETLPLRNFASQRVDLRRVSMVREGDQAIGAEVRAKIVKNRLAKPFTQTELTIRFDTGLCPLTDLLNLGVQDSIIQQVRSPDEPQSPSAIGPHLPSPDESKWGFQFAEHFLGQYRGRVLMRLYQNPDLARELWKLIRERRSKPTVPPADEPTSRDTE